MFLDLEACKITFRNNAALFVGKNKTQGDCFLAVEEIIN